MRNIIIITITVPALLLAYIPKNLFTRERNKSQNFTLFFASLICGFTDIILISIRRLCCILLLKMKYLVTLWSNSADKRTKPYSYPMENRTSSKQYRVSIEVNYNQESGEYRPYIREQYDREPSMLSSVLVVSFPYKDREKEDDPDDMIDFLLNILKVIPSDSVMIIKLLILSFLSHGIFLWMKSLSFQLNKNDANSRKIYGE